MLILCFGQSVRGNQSFGWTPLQARRTCQTFWMLGDTLDGWKRQNLVDAKSIFILLRAQECLILRLLLALKALLTYRHRFYDKTQLLFIQALGSGIHWFVSPLTYFLHRFDGTEQNSRHKRM